MPRAAPAPAPPAGLAYFPDFLDVDEERAILAEVERLDFRPVVMRGQVARRTVLHFGWDYDYDGWQIHPTTPAPSWLAALRDRCAEVWRRRLRGESPQESAAPHFEQFLIARYPPGATIGWHRDAPMFGAPVAGVSLLSPCTMKFRRKRGDGFEMWPHPLEPRSLYLLAGDARSQWQHSIPPTKDLRYSITMRTLRARPARDPEADRSEVPGGG